MRRQAAFSPLPLSGLNLSVAALVGFVALFGISIQNRVILVARIRELAAPRP